MKVVRSVLFDISGLRSLLQKLRLYIDVFGWLMNVLTSDRLGTFLFQVCTQWLCYSSLNVEVIFVIWLGPMIRA